MKSFLPFYIVALTVILASGCSHDEVADIQPVIPPADTTDTLDIPPSRLDSIWEKDLSLKSGMRVYTDSSGNEYHTVIFNSTDTIHVYKINLQEGKMYNMVLSRDCAYWTDFYLLKTETDTMFTGEGVMGPDIRNQIYWRATATGTYYIVLEYSDANFHDYECRLVIEEMTTFNLTYNGLELLCSGDWKVNDSGYLTLTMHEALGYKWAKVLNNPYYYTFSYNYTRASGKPDNYVGIECYATDEVQYLDNIPKAGYLFDVIAPSGWRIGTYHIEGDAGWWYGNLPENLPLGNNYWHNISVTTFNDSLAFSVNNIEAYKQRNYEMLDQNLYIMVNDRRQDEVWFKDLKLE